jgi:signal transduction histidine kinase
MISTAQVASMVVVAVGLLLFWANPKRKVNRAVFVSSTVVAGWLACTHFAVTDQENGLFWLRWTFAVGALAPLTLWMVKESIVGTFRLRNREWIRKNSYWFISAAVLFGLPFTEFFIPSSSSKLARVRGVGYGLYYIGVIALYGRLLWDALKILKSLSGARKLELQVWLCGGCVVATSIYILIALEAVTHDGIYPQLKPVAVLVFYAGTAYAITSHRIFDARQIMLVGIEKIAILICAAAASYAVIRAFGLISSDVSAIVVTTAVVITAASGLQSWFDRRFDFVSHAGAARQAAFAAAQSETRFEKLDASFTSLLKGWGHTEKSMILSGTNTTLTGGGLELAIDGVVVQTLNALRWATPERLSRERQSPERLELAKFLNDHDLGLLVVEEGAALTVILGVGIGASRRPYTYPQVTQLMELASIVQGAFERSHYSAKAQQAEQLATVGLLGASVAHEIRNPLVSIKTFVQLLPTHYHQEEFRNKFFRLIGDEVGRIDQLTQQLLDLASPRTYSAELIELHALITAGLDLVAAKAADRQVELLTDFKARPDTAFTDASAAKQVMLNLCFNAIQAVENHSAEKRWVRVATRNTAIGIEMAVADSGPGIAPEIRPKLFQPFQTTKSTGFGLGLAICSDILANVQASISVDPHEPGCGATFRVTFPCQPSLS